VSSKLSFYFKKVDYFKKIPNIASVSLFRIMPIIRHAFFCNCATLAALACHLPGQLEAQETAYIANPIAKIARVFDPELVKIEDRVTWLNNRVSTFAVHREHAMKTDLGYRGCRAKVGDPDPTVTLDLGVTKTIDCIFLVPAQREFFEDSGIFPKRFTLEVSNFADFRERSVVFSSGGNISVSIDGNPVPFKVRDSARYVRLTVHQGEQRTMNDVFGLSELAVISGDDTISLDAAVATTGGSMNSKGLWYPEALVDGRTPLGVWQSIVNASGQTDDSVVVANETERVSWSLELERAAPLNRIVLFPYQLSHSLESLVIPELLEVFLKSPGSNEEQLVYTMENPTRGAGYMTPLVIPLGGKIAKGIRIAGVRPHKIGDINVYAISEIEAWSEGVNLASGVPVTREYQQERKTTTALTDGFTSKKLIAKYATWLDQLAERGRIENELATLKPYQHQQASESELNATWGSAMILGLTFLIPVFIVERRRLMSKDQLDHIRKRIASDLHDDIGSNLGSISLIARSARKDLVRLQGPEGIAEDLGEVESIARESSLAMRDIVWLLEREQDSIGDLVQRMRETAGRLLREIDYTVECESHKTAAKLSLDAKRHLFLFYKEAIHNVLKHSHANSVSIRLWDEDDKLALEILDNGVGLPTSNTPDRPSVRKLEDRARVLEGLLEVISSKDSGTKIRLLVKRSHLTAHPTLA
jgi:signal transduction histidine kinase